MVNLKHQPITEQRNQSSQNLDQLGISEILRIVNNEDKLVAQSVAEDLPDIEIAIENIVQVMSAGGRLFYIGAGSSGRLGILDASECPPTFGGDPTLVNGLIAGGDHAIKNSVENAEDDIEAGKRDIAAVVKANDVVVGITASGRTPYVLGAIKEANQRGAVTVGVSCNSNTRLSETVQFPIEVPVGPEVITGSTRMKAGTAQKMVLNMITSVTMIKLGKVYGNLMVNVRASNDKLRDRVIRIIKEATGVDEAIAQKYSALAEGDAKVAILMLKFPINRSEAQMSLEKSGGGIWGKPYGCWKITRIDANSK